MLISGPRFRRSCGVAAGLALLLAACTSAPAGPGGGAAGPSGSVTIALLVEPPDLMAQSTVSGTSHPVVRNVNEALINRDPVTNELVPELALSWELVSPTTWRFKLREGVKFHDGTPFNAEAAAYGLNYMWNRARPSTLLARLGPDLNTKATGEYTLEATTVTPDPIIPLRFYLSGIPSMKQMKEQEATYPLKPIGTGPYKFVEWVKGDHITLEANPDWWGIKDTKDARGKQVFKEAKYVYRTDSAVRAAMVKTGEADFARNLTSKDQCKDIACASKDQVETQYLRIDMQNVLLKDLRIRKAIAFAIDKDALVNTVYGGGVVAGQIVGPSALGYNANLKPYPFDKAQAQALVNEVRATGVDVRIPLLLVQRPDTAPRVSEGLEFVTSALNGIGLNVKYEIWDPLRHETMLTERGKGPISPNRNILTIHRHGNELMDFAASVNSYYRCEGTQSTYCNPAVDELHKAANEKTGKERDAAYQAIAARVYDDYGIIPIGRLYYYWGLSSRLKWEPRLDGLMLLKEMSLK